MGGLGSWVAEFLARAGVGFLRLADDDVVELANIHRQALYGEAEAAGRQKKVVAAAARLAVPGPVLARPRLLHWLPQRRLHHHGLRLYLHPHPDRPLPAGLEGSR